MKDFEIKFYAHLGLLSVKFAKLDYNIAKILRKLIDSDEESIAITLTDKNNLSQNLDLLHQINRIRSFNEPVISDLIIKVNTVKKDRNLFIHGIWGYPFEDSNETSIICDEKKISYKEDKDTDGNRVGQTWKHNKIHKFNLSQIKILISEIDIIINIQDELIHELEINSLYK